MSGRYGLIGKSLSHSLSPHIHQMLGDYSYRLYELAEDALDAFLIEKRFCGVNITIPYKKIAIQYCDEISEISSRIGAVNVIVNKQGVLYGDNTDYFGLRTMIEQNAIKVEGKDIVILGSGATSETARVVSEDMGAKLIVKISRSGSNTYEDLQRFSKFDIIINTTPVGMHPNISECPVDLSLFDRLTGVIDVVYNPIRTRLLLQAAELGIPHCGGLSMLVHQAAKAYELFFDQRVDEDKTEKIHRTLYSEQQNIVLIGMPGSGKTTIGKKLAISTNRKFVDIDVCISEREGMPISEIFERKGEAYFRSLERAAIAEVSVLHGAVISTGGGAVLCEDNMLSLSQNGILFWIQRDIELLETSGRPLSHRDKLYQMYDEREPLYERYADFSIANDGEIDHVVNKILRLI